ncbi:MAG: hypothetical protein WD846_04500 [Patescibacteria group bacterium]
MHSTNWSFEQVLSDALAEPMTALQRSSLDRRMAPSLAQTRHAPRWRLALAVVPIVAVASVAVWAGATILSPPSAFATWTAVPTPVDPAFAEQMERNCATNRPAEDLSSFDPQTRAEMEAQQEIFRKLPLVVVDRRGRAAIALFAERRPEGQAVVTCMTIAEEDGGSPVNGGGGSATGALESPPDGPLRLFSALRDQSDAGIYTAYVGHVDPDVVQVTVERNSGGSVIASVANGYFVAWWPGDSYATTLVAYGEGGQILAEIGNNGWDFRMAE